MHTIQSHPFRSICFFILLIVITTYGNTQEYNFTCGTQNDLTLTFIVPNHNAGDAEINKVEIWISLVPPGVIDAGTSFNLISPQGTSPTSFTNNGNERLVSDPDNLGDEWRVKLSDYGAGLILELRRNSVGTLINTTADDDIWEFTISSFSSTDELIGLGISIYSKQWLITDYFTISEPNRLAYIDPDPCNQYPEVTNLYPTYPGSPVDISTNTYTVGYTAEATDDCGCTLTYDWDFPTNPGDNEETSGLSVKSVTYPVGGEGDYEVMVRVKDDDDAYSDFVTMDIPIHAPDISFSADVIGGKAPLEVTFSLDGAVEDCDDGELVDFTWDFGDGTPDATGLLSEVTHTYTATGLYTVSLTVVDNINLETTFTIVDAVNVTAENEYPGVTLSLLNHPPVTPVNFGDGDTYVINYHAEGSDPDGDPADLTYNWDLDGQPSTPCGDPDKDRCVQFTSAGDYTISVFVEDLDDDISPEIEHNITLTPPAPGFTPDVITGREPLTVTFTNTSSDDAAGAIAGYVWDFDSDGTVPVDPFTTYEHVFSQGTYTVNLTAIDNLSLAATSSDVTITVGPTNNPPVAGGITYAYSSGDLGIDYTVEFSVSASDPDAGDTLTYAWSYDGVPESPTLSSTDTHQYADEGSYAVSVTVEDGYGGLVTRTLGFSISVPFAAFSVNPPGGVEGTTITFSNKSVDDDSIDTAILVITESGGGPTVDTLDITSVDDSHFFGTGTAGNYDVILTVTDNMNLTTVSNPVVITIAPPEPGDPPIITKFGFNIPITPTYLDSATDPYELSFMARATDDCDCGLTHDYSFTPNSAGNFSTTNASGADHNFTIPYTSTDQGDCTATLTVTDDEANPSSPVTIDFTLHEPAVSISATGSTTGRDPMEVTFNQNSSDTDGYITGYTWKFDHQTNDAFDDEISSPNMGNQYTRTFDQQGVWRVTLVVTDDMHIMKESNYVDITVNAPNNPPSIQDDSITVSYSGGDFSSGTYMLSFDATLLDDDGDDLTCTWSFDGNKVTEGVSFPVSTTSMDHSRIYGPFTTTDAHGVSLSIDDGYEGGTYEVSQLFLLLRPFAAFSASPPGGEEDVVITFTNQSLDDSTIIAANLLIADDLSALDTSPITILDLLDADPLVRSYTFDTAGTYYARLDVTDDMNLSASSPPTTIVIEPPGVGSPPVITLFDYEFPATPTYLDSYQLRFKANAVDDCGCVLNYDFEFTPDIGVDIDGTSPSGTEYISPWVDFNDPDTHNYTLSLTVTDNADNESAPLSLEFTVYEPTVSITPNGPDEGRSPFEVTITKTTDDTDGSIKDYIWKFDYLGDGVIEDQIMYVDLPDFTHTLTDQGEWDVTLTVVDGENIANDSEPLMITVGPPNNCPTIDGPIEVSWESGEFTGGNYYLNFTVPISDLDEDDLTCTWTIDGDEVEEVASFPAGTASMSYTLTYGPFINTGGHDVELRIDDGYGCEDPIYKSKNFTLNPPVVTIFAYPEEEFISFNVDLSANINSSNEIESRTWTINGTFLSSEESVDDHLIETRGEYIVEHSVIDSMHLAGIAQKSIKAYKQSKEVVIVIDHSGSMDDDIKWPTAVGTLNLYAEISNYQHGSIEPISIDPYLEMDQLGIVSYTSTTGSLYSWGWSTPADLLNTWPDSTEDGTSLTPMPIEIPGNWVFSGGFHWTPTGDALTRAIGLFEEEGSLPEEADGTDKEKYIILLTDGQNNSGTEEIIEFAATRANHTNEKIKNHNVYTVVIGDDNNSWPEQISDLSVVSGGEYRLSEDPEPMYQFFLEIFGQENTTDIIPPDDVNVDTEWATFTVDDNNRVFFVTAWENVPGNGPYALQATRVTDGEGNPVNITIAPSDIPGYDNVFESRHVDNYAFLVVDNTLIEEENTIGMSGEWIIDLVDLDGSSVNDTVNAQYFAVVNLRLNADFAIDKKPHKTGDKMILTANIREYGTPVSGAVVKAHVTYPQEGAGETMSLFAYLNLYDSKRDSKSIMYHHLQAAWRKENRNSLITDDGSIYLKDDGNGMDEIAGDGIYTGIFDTLEYEGNYTFEFNAIGKNSLNQTFKRTETLSQFVALQVDADISKWYYEVNPTLLDNDLREVIVFFEPMDTFGRHLGPYLDNIITFDVRGGKPDPTFHYDIDHKYGNGVYYQRIVYNEWTDVPKITIKVRDKTIVENIAVRTHNALNFSLYFGTFIFDSGLNIFTSPPPYTIGARISIHPIRIFGIEADLSISGYEPDPNADLVLQLSGNLVINMGSFLNLGRVFYPYIATGAGVVYLQGFGIDDYFVAINLGGGLKYDLTNFLQIRVDARYFLILDIMNLYQTHNFQTSLGFVVGF